MSLSLLTVLVVLIPFLGGAGPVVHSEMGGGPRTYDALVEVAGLNSGESSSDAVARLPQQASTSQSSFASVRAGRLKTKGRGLGEAATTEVRDTTDEGGDPIYAPTPQKAVYQMLEMAGVTSRDTVYDLGSGDGRIVIAAAKKFGARAIGIEIDSSRVAESKIEAQNQGVTELTEFRQANIFTTDISDATVVTLYLLPETLKKLRSKLLADLEPGTVVVSHDFIIPGWTPDRRMTVKTPSGWKTYSTLYLWKIPEDKSLPQ